MAAEKSSRQMVNHSLFSGRTPLRLRNMAALASKLKRYDFCVLFLASKNKEKSGSAIVTASKARRVFNLSLR